MADKSVVSKIVEPYAEALLELAVSSNTFDEVNSDMNIVSQFLSSSADLQKFLSNPLVTQEAKKKVVNDILGEQISQSTLRFLMVLVDRGRIGFLDSVAQRYLELSYKQASIEIATVTSAVQLSSQQQKDLVEKLKKLTGAEQVKLQLKVNSELIGGFIVEIGSKLIDTSIAGQLKQINSLLSSATI
jgi:F-type H+-transporting ATPase subunit delta